MEMGTSRPRVNRAVAAVQSATAATISASPLITTRSTAGQHKSAVTRFASFDALCQAKQKPDPHALLRKMLDAKLPRPSLRNDVMAMGDAAVERVLQFLGPLSRNAAAFTQTCRAVRRALLHLMNLEAAVITPTMVNAPSLLRENVLKAVFTFTAARGNQVRTLVLNEDGINAVKREDSSGTPVAGLSLPAPWVLQLVSHLPYLSVLDIRHVQLTEAHHSQALHYLLSDLHLAATGTLSTLKMDAYLMRYWAPGWWRRLVNLSSLVVGSRYYSLEPTPDTTTGAAASTLLEVPADFFTLMREGGRRWQLKLWVPLQATSLKKILMPAGGTIFAGVGELLINMRCNERTCEWADTAANGTLPISPPITASASGAVSELPQDTRNSAVPRKAGSSAAGNTESGEVLTFPALTTMTVVDVQERPEVAAEVYQALMDVAPGLENFNVCDTVPVGKVIDAQKKRHGRG
ncbi:hypothetical protein JKF63_03721 [Porcisia hertigi]|uniref:Uncharacterized protein n=1 Tax=Porcisia hertigi TaxID=2761500 RepID=A0A836IBP4_9TRYP|nr:hypothetical protein JKF63_03721 [Porcisia hertigi]